MGAAIGGRHTVVAATTIPTPRHTLALTGAMVIILMRRLTTTRPQELTAGKRVLTALTDRRPPELAIILTPGLMRGEPVFRLRMAAEAQHRRIIRTPVRTLRRGKVRARMLSGAARMCHEETRALPWDIIRRLMEQWQAPRPRRAERRPPPARSGETARPPKLPAATCMPGTMAMFIRTPGTVGRSTTTEAGIL
jgi:hypothetical protein